MKIAFIFPGQGAQTVGMCADFIQSCPAAAAVFERANEIVGYDLKKLCIEGPADQLNSTVISQPAIFVVSAAILDVIRNEPALSHIKPDVTAGLSLGEYTALYAAGLISFDDTLTLVQKRGQAMQAAADATNGSMVSIIGLDEDKVQKLCDEAAQGELLTIANFNCPGQVVISGSKAACNRALTLAEKYGAAKAVPLAVAGAFHTSFMASAVEASAKVLDKMKIADPAGIKVIANLDAAYYETADHIRTGLKRQLTSPVLWQKCMEKLIADGIETFYEIGPGRVLTGLMKRINRKAKVINFSTMQSLKDIV